MTFTQYVVALLADKITLLMTFASIFAGSLAAGLAGFAFSAIAGALLFHWLEPIQAVPLLLACSITTQLLSITSLWGEMQWQRCAPYLLGGFVGIPVGAWLLAKSDPRVFAAGFGLFLIGYSAYLLLKPNLKVRDGGPLVEVFAGFAGGITGGATAFPGAFPTIWCLMRGLPKNEQRGIVQPFILIMQIATLLYYSKTGILAAGALTTFLWCVPAVLAGTLLGLRLFNRVDDVKFRYLVLIFLLVAGFTLLL